MAAPYRACIRSAHMMAAPYRGLHSLRSYDGCALSGLAFAPLMLLRVQRDQIQIDSGAHRRRNSNALNVTALQRGRARFDHGINQDVSVFLELTTGKLDLADGNVNDSRFVDAVFDFTGLD